MESAHFRTAALTVAVCTTVQACVWIVLSLLALLTAFEVIGPTALDSKDLWHLTSVEAFKLAVIGCYFPRSAHSACCVEDDLLLRGAPSMRISIVYLITSCTWLCTAVLLLQDIRKKKALLYLIEKKTANLTLCWAAVTCAISWVDFIVAVMFGIDYSKMTGAVACVGDYDLTVPRILMSLAARGYVVWLFNVLAAVLLALHAVKTPVRDEKEGRKLIYDPAESNDPSQHLL